LFKLSFCFLYNIEKLKKSLEEFTENEDIMNSTLNQEEGKLEKIKILKEELKDSIDEITTKIETLLLNSNTFWLFQLVVVMVLNYFLFLIICHLFLINLALFSCRLKDILELFMDTGIGRDGYSIIGQGKIDEILSS